MPSNKLGHYYTLRLTQTNPFTKVEVAKWQEMGSQPTQTYEVFPEARPGAGMCSCPAYRVCKHTLAVKAAIADGTINESWKWKWLEAKTNDGPRLIPEPAEDI